MFGLRSWKRADGCEYVENILYQFRRVGAERERADPISVAETEGLCRLRGGLIPLRLQTHREKLPRLFFLATLNDETHEAVEKIQLYSAL